MAPLLCITGRIKSPVLDEGYMLGAASAEQRRSEALLIISR